jgi:hypothetical protein
MEPLTMTTVVRVTAAIAPETKAVLDELCDLMDTSFSKLSGSLLDEARPQLEHLRDSIKNAKENPGASYTAMHLALIESQRYALEAQADFLEQIGKQKPKP